MNILGSDGTLRLTVPEGTEGAVYREYETSDGKKGSKWELIFKSLSGKISNLQTHDGDYGMNLMLSLEYDGGEDTISIGTGTPFGEDFMKKLPNINLDEYIDFAPYAFTDDAGKIRKGVSIKQGDTKIQNYFYKPSEEKGGKGENVNGYPNPEGDTSKYTKDDWKIYFMQARKFLVKHTEENFLPKFADKAHVKVTVDGTPVQAPEYPTEEAPADKF
jgi:hypothetical protein